MRNIAVFERPQETDIELNGWLEASWLPNSTLILSDAPKEQFRPASR